MEIMTKIFDKNGIAITKKIKNEDPAWFEIDFSIIPDIGDKVLIADGEAQGEYVVEDKVYSVELNTGRLLFILKYKPLDNSLRMAIDT